MPVPLRAASSPGARRRRAGLPRRARSTPSPGCATAADPGPGARGEAEERLRLRGREEGRHDRGPDDRRLARAAAESPDRPADPGHRLPRPAVQGKPVLTWWQGDRDRRRHRQGESEIYDASLRRVRHRARERWPRGDLHEFQLTPRGTAFITAYRELPADLSGIGGPKQAVRRGALSRRSTSRAVDVLFEWHSIDHVPLAESTQANREPARNANQKRPLDYFHVNSVADGPSGTILISGAERVDRLPPRPRRPHVWRLGGKQSDFGPKAAVPVRLPAQRAPARQPAQPVRQRRDPRVEPFSRPLVLRLDVPARRRGDRADVPAAEEIASPYEGNLELLPDGGALVAGAASARSASSPPTAGCCCS